MSDTVVRYEPPPQGFRGTAKNLRGWQSAFAYLADMFCAMADKCEELAVENGEAIEANENQELHSDSQRRKETETDAVQVPKKSGKAAH